MPTSPITSTATNRASERKYIGYARRSQTRMSTSATPSMITQPTPNRTIWREAQGSKLPLAAE